ncbi:MAG: putative molybdenum carrier protein [Desulfobacterales bacterium]|nr:putative molybdenum carrier protein [Desulfobacterales bacterium]
MLQKIISGGQTGADRAALDVALKFNIPHGGWVPKGRRTENGPLPEIYELRETPTDEYQDRTLQNILDSQATVIFGNGPLRGGSLLTLKMAKDKSKPHLHIDLSMSDTFEASIILHSFIIDNGISQLNVAGPRASDDPGIYEEVKIILEATFYLLSLDVEAGPTEFDGTLEIEDVVAFPEKVVEAVGLVAADLSLKTKVSLAKLGDNLIFDLYYAWKEPIRLRMGFDFGNTALLEACRERAGYRESFTIEDAIMEIIKALKDYLNRSYRLKVVK